MPAQMTSTAWGQGAKNALIIGTAMLVVWGIITAAVVLIFAQPIFRTVGLSGAAIFVLSQLVFYATWFYGRSVAGPVLLDCGPHPTWWLFLLNAALFVMLNLMNSLDTILKLIAGPEATWTTILFSIGWPVLMISLVPFWLVMASGRLQMRENGIWQYWGLLRWSKIDTYRFANDATLMIRAKGFLSSRIQGALPVPPGQKQAVEELLAKHCPAQATA